MALNNNKCKYQPKYSNLRGAVSRKYKLNSYV